MNSLLNVPKHAALIYDVGLHEGQDTDFYLKKGFRVVAFEADPDLAQGCRVRFAQAIAERRLTIVEGAIVAPDQLQPGQTCVRFFKNTNSVWGTVRPDFDERNRRLGTDSNELDIAVVDFADCLKTYGIPHYMKIDIEGADIVCLRALARFKQKPDYLSMESEKVSFAKLRSELCLMSSLGYHRFIAVQQTTVRHQRTPSPALEGHQVEHRFEYGSSGLFGLELPGRWMPRSLALLQYAFIFIGYRLVGDDSRLLRTERGRRFMWWLAKKLNRDVPGWYDTHARHEDAMRSGPNDGPTALIGPRAGIGRSCGADSVISTNVNDRRTDKSRPG